MSDNTALLQALQAIQQQLQQQSQQLQQQLQQQSQQQIEHNTKILEALNIREQPKRDNRRYGSSSDEDEEGDQADLANQQRKRMPRIKADIPTFLGSLNIEDFLDWVSETEKYFELMDIPEDSQVKYVAYKLRGATSSWWDNLQTRRRRQRKQPIRTWRKMKRVMFARSLFDDIVLASTKKSEDSQRHNIFQTRCKINQEVFNVIVDGGSKHEQNLNALARINHAETIQDSVKNQPSKFMPKAIFEYVQTRLERTVLDVIKKNPVNLFQFSSTPSAEPTELELKPQLYEKMFQTAEYLRHDAHRALYDALQESI
ncbi:hypothetical protein Tco_1283377 [Tanacetum coccineum]